MRIISQDGAIDIPYNISSLYIKKEGDGCLVYAVVPGVDKPFLMAEYLFYEVGVEQLQKLRSSLEEESVYSRKVSATESVSSNINLIFRFS